MLLAVYAPRLERLDVFPARQGARVASVRTRCSGPGCLLPAGALFGRGSPLGGGGGGSGGGRDGGGGCWLLECGSGELWSVDAAVAAALGAASS